MRKLRALTGLPVVCRGRRIGRLAQAELSPDLRRMDGVWIGGGFGGMRFIPSESLEMLGAVSVIADSTGNRRRRRAQSLFRRAVSTDGERLGAITDAEIDEMSFAVTSLELSAGLWDDLRRGRRRVIRYTADPATGDVIVDPADDETEARTDEDRRD